MDKVQFAKFAMALKTYYPMQDIIPNQEATELWYDVLNDLDYEIAQQALKKWVMVQKWAPTIADIRQQAENESYRLKIEELEKIDMQTSNIRELFCNNKKTIAES